MLWLRNSTHMFRFKNNLYSVGGGDSETFRYCFTIMSLEVNYFWLYTKETFIKARQGLVWNQQYVKHLLITIHTAGHADKI